MTVSISDKNDTFLCFPDGTPRVLESDGCVLPLWRYKLFQSNVIGDWLQTADVSDRLLLLL